MSVLLIREAAIVSSFSPCYDRVSSCWIHLSVRFVGIMAPKKVLTKRPAASVCKRPASAHSDSDRTSLFCKPNCHWYFVEKIKYGDWLLEPDRTWEGCCVFTDKHVALRYKCFIPHVANPRSPLDSNNIHWLCRVRKEKRTLRCWEFEDLPSVCSCIIEDTRYERGLIRLHGCVCGKFLCDCPLHLLSMCKSSQ